MADQTERLPDAVLLAILNRVGDVKDLGRCCAVSRRFHALALQADRVLVRVDCVLSDPPKPSQRPPLLLHFARLLLARLLGRPPRASHHSPADVLRRFRHLRLLRVLLPSPELALPPRSLLRWVARFGSSLHSCVLLLASSSDALKTRVVWTISSLVAASARHFLMQPIVAAHPTLRELELADADGQGVLRMGPEQLAESRATPATASAWSQRTLVPALDMRLWYAPRLEAAGAVLEGATLVAIRPSPAGAGFDPAWIVGEFDEEPYALAASMLMKTRTYCLELNSF